MGFREVELNIDSMVVVNVVKIDIISSLIELSLVKSIMHVSERNWVVKITHSYREANRCANTLANIGCNIDCTLTIYPDCPLYIRRY